MAFTEELVAGVRSTCFATTEVTYQEGLLLRHTVAAASMDELASEAWPRTSRCTRPTSIS